MKYFYALAALWLFTHYAYIIVMASSHLRDRGLLTTYWYVHIIPLAICGVIADFLFSLTFGWVIFLEPPRLELFTAKCSRNKALGRGYRRGLAEWFCWNLNLFDPGHC